MKVRYFELIEEKMARNEACDLRFCTGESPPVLEVRLPFPYVDRLVVIPVKRLVYELKAKRLI